MKTFQSRRRVNYSAEEMFALVKDVESYPKFVPLCEGLKIKSRTMPREGVEVIQADMEVGFKAICERFTSNVTCDIIRHEILIEYVNGPFRKMEGRWFFKNLPAQDQQNVQSEIQFKISYELKSFALGLIMGAMFDGAFQKYAEAFVNRAHKVYGATNSVNR